MYFVIGSRVLDSNRVGLRLTRERVRGTLLRRFEALLADDSLIAVELDDLTLSLDKVDFLGTEA